MVRIIRTGDLNTDIGADGPGILWEKQIHWEREREEEIIEEESEIPEVKKTSIGRRLSCRKEK